MKNGVTKNLIKKVSEGDKEAYTQMYSLLSNNIASYANLFFNDEFEAVKLACEVLIDLPQLCKTYLRFKDIDFYLSIRAIVKNKAFEILIIRNSKIVNDDCELYAQYGSKFINAILSDSEFKNLFTEEEYSLLAMHYVYKQDFKEIGISLNKSRNELKAIYRSAVDKAEEYLKKISV